MNKQIFFLVGLIGALAFTGCRKDFEEINTNPNEPTAVSPGFLLTSAQKTTMDVVYDSFWVAALKLASSDEAIGSPSGN